MSNSIPLALPFIDEWGRGLDFSMKVASPFAQSGSLSPLKARRIKANPLHQST